MEESTTEASEEGTLEDSDSEAQSAADGEVKETKPQEEQWVRPNKFRTYEDVLRSYDNLEPEYHKVANENARLRRELAKVSSSQAEDKETRLRKLREAAAQDPYEAIRGVIRPELEKVQEEIKTSKFESSYRAAMLNEEFSALSPVMANIVTNDDGLFDDYPGLRRDPRILNALFLMAKGMTVGEAAKAAESNGKAKGEAAVARKVKMQVESNSSSQGKTNKAPTSAAEMKKRILSGEGF